MLREVGLALMISGLVTMVVLLGMRRSAFNVSWVVMSTGTTSVYNISGKTVFLVVSDPLKVEKVEGYSYLVRVRHLTYITQSNINVESSKVYLVPSPVRIMPLNIKDKESLKELDSYLEERKVTSCELGAVGECTLELPFDREVSVVALILANVTRGRPVVPPPSVRFNVEARLSPSTGQVMRALDIFAMGAVIVGMHYYYNRDEYPSLRGKLGKFIPNKRKYGEEGGRNT